MLVGDLLVDLLTDHEICFDGIALETVVFSSDIRKLLDLNKDNAYIRRCNIVIEHHAVA